MDILGIRFTPKLIYFVIVNNQGEKLSWENSNDSHKIKIPENISETGELLNWFYKEFNSIFTKYKNIEQIAFKEPEYKGNVNNGSFRRRIYYEGLLQYWAYENELPIIRKTYTGFRNGKRVIKKDERLDYCKNNIINCEELKNNELVDAILAARSACMSSGKWDKNTKMLREYFQLRY
jgi:hypothetical protein